MRTSSWGPGQSKFSRVTGAIAITDRFVPARVFIYQSAPRRVWCSQFYPRSLLGRRAQYPLLSIFLEQWHLFCKTLVMNSIAREARSLLRRPSWASSHSLSCDPHNHQQWRGIRVKVLNGNLDRALAYMQRVMQSSGIERMIKQEQTHHIKNSEKRILARKNLERKLRSQEFARKLQAVLIKKVR